MLRLILAALFGVLVFSAHAQTSISGITSVGSLRYEEFPSTPAFCLRMPDAYTVPANPDLNPSPNFKGSNVCLPQPIPAFDLLPRPSSNPLDAYLFTGAYGMVADSNKWNCEQNHTPTPCANWFRLVASKKYIEALNALTLSREYDYYNYWLTTSAKKNPWGR